MHKDRVFSETWKKERKNQEIEQIFQFIGRRTFIDFIINIIDVRHSIRTIFSYTSINDDATSIRFDQCKYDSLTVLRDNLIQASGKATNPEAIRQLSAINSLETEVVHLKWMNSSNEFS